MLTTVQKITAGGRGRRLKAILAGGLVLGVGAAVTLAAWNDSEFATGTFGAGHFDLKGSTDGTTFGDHASGSPAALSFSTGFSALSPGDVVAAPFVLHLDKDTNFGASVVVGSAAATGTATAQLSYGIVQVASAAACTPAATGSATIVPAGTGMNATTGAVPFTLVRSTTLGTTPGADFTLCLQVKAAAGLVQSSTATGTWSFVATSTP
jgi:predicted ribosomally synthesized peptide with SipW-like signal peptide